jgi:hypothetical protein
MRLDPFYEPYASVVLAVANYTLEQYSGGIVAPARFCCPGAQIPACHALLAATLVRTGQLEEVRAEAAEVLRTRPRLTISGVGRRLAAFSTSLMQCAWRGCPSRRHVSSPCHRLRQRRDVLKLRADSSALHANSTGQTSAALPSGRGKANVNITSAGAPT